MIEVLGTRSGLAAVARRFAHDDVAVLAYHNVVTPADAGRGDSSLHLPLSTFIAQIERVARTHEVVSLDAAAASFSGDVDAHAPSRSRRPRAVITFDDAYRGAVTLALPELVRRGLPATVFVAPGLLGAAGTWWDLAAEAGLLDTAARTGALERQAGRGDLVMKSLFPDAAGAPGAAGVPDLPRSYGIATEDELRTHVAPGIMLGSHSWNHEFLPALEPAELRTNLGRTLDWLTDFGVPWTRWLALPYGGGSPELGAYARDAGHDGVLRVEGGLWRRADDAAWVPRMNVPAGLSVRGLELRTSGLVGR